MREAVKVSNDSPVLLDHFLNNATEVDVDCIADGEVVFIGGVMEHIEQAGVHSGDSACSRSEEHTSELQSLMRISYAVFCLKKKKKNITYKLHETLHIKTMQYS